ncbi:methyltransferase domain-containing protein [Accumulibacter sp.]|uniref:class I SAM-dependent methyltransferase n=1 Tax=Accumulibacter sp. TaxID=2053492 RepID=UPI0025DAAEA4|nr:methyltransferase domain-containing protein [Accumulibacter sp.]MCP5228903.1 class I SAM-dependent methyltransferase [Accumulibacter sp.]
MRVLAKLLYIFFAMNRRIVRSFEYRMPAGFVCNLHALNDRVVAETLTTADNQIVLDIGAGTRTPFVQQVDPTLGNRIIALDILADDLALNPDTPLKIVADCGRGIPIKTAATDMVVTRSFLEHLPDTGAFVAECARVIRPGGLFIAVFPCRYSPFALINRMLPNRIANTLLRWFQPERAGDLGFPAYYDRLYYAQIERTLAKHGFTLELVALRYYQSTYYDFFLPLYLVFVLYDLAVFALGSKNLCCQMFVVARRGTG